jgi:hypothetical protein
MTRSVLPLRTGSLELLEVTKEEDIVDEEEDSTGTPLKVT